MKWVVVRKSDMQVKDISMSEPKLYGFGSSIKRVFYIFEEQDDVEVQVGDTCTVDGENRTYETP